MHPTRAFITVHVAGLFAIAAVLFAVPLHACTCAIPPAVPEAKAAAEALFMGRVVEVDVGDYGHIPSKRVVLRIDAVWKGSPGDEVTIFTGTWDGDCGFPFELDQDYLVYAEEYGTVEGPHRLVTNICSRTALSENNPDLKELGPPLTSPTLATSWGQIKRIWR